MDVICSGLMDNLVAVARNAAEIVYSREYLETQNKEGIGNIVTEADKRSEEIIKTQLRKLYPHCSFLAEESGVLITREEFQGTGLVFVIDPVDGTTNYKYGLPPSAISIGAWTRGLPVASVIVDISTSDVYQFEGGIEFGQYKSAFVGRVGVLKEHKVLKMQNKNPVADLSEAIVGTDWAIYDSAYDNIAVWQRLRGKIMALRLFGSAVMGLVYTMTGQYTCYIHNAMKPFDVGAAVPMLLNAGLKVTNWKKKSLVLRSMS